LAALFTAAVSTSFLVGAGRMLAFGLGTIPALATVGWLSARAWRLGWPRYAAAAMMAFFGTQFALRGLASWGLLPHQMLAGIMLW
jgi:sulfite exporter TauE/SafE